MNEKNFFYCTLCTTSILLLIMGICITIIDPFYQYHKPLAFLSYRPNMNLHSYTNPGIAKNFDYDTVVLGSSMTRTISASYAKKVNNWNLVKLSIPEARGKDIKEMYSLIHKDTKTVIIGLDTFAFQVDKDQEANEKPHYLWNSNPFDDVSYIFNKNVLTNLQQIFDDTIAGKPSYTMDEYQNWEEVRIIEPNKILKMAKNYEGNSQFFEGTYSDEMINDNLNNNLISIISEHPNQNFILYFPPYSIFYWMKIIKDNKLNAEFDEIAMIMNAVLDFENVKLFFPMDNKEIILNHSHYLDFLHYDTFLSNQVIDEIADDSHRITKDNVSARLSNFKYFLKEFPYTETLEKGLAK